MARTGGNIAAANRNVTAGAVIETAADASAIAIIRTRITRFGDDGTAGDCNIAAGTGRETAADASALLTRTGGDVTAGDFDIVTR